MSMVISPSTHWNLVVSRDIDSTLRQFLAHQNKERKGDLSHFVEESVRARILDLTASEAKAENGAHSAIEMEIAIDEALTWARQ